MEHANAALMLRPVVLSIGVRQRRQTAVLCLGRGGKLSRAPQSGQAVATWQIPRQW